MSDAVRDPPLEPRRRSTRSKHALSLAAALALGGLLPTRAALAFCRTASCGDAGTGQECTPAGKNDCAIPLFWSSPCVAYSVQQDASKKVTFAETEKALKAAFATWEAADCGAGSPRIIVTEAAAAECTRHEYNQKKANQNLIVYRDDVWPYKGADDQLALTTVTYNPGTGEIYDADMEINSADKALSTSDSGADFDLQSIVTHEAGHFLGLAHAPEADTMMFRSYNGRRSLSTDDVSAICTVYPAGAPIPATCDSTPRHGFSTLCADEQPPAAAAGCSCRFATPEAPSWMGLAAAACVLAIATRRRTSRR